MQERHAAMLAESNESYWQLWLESAEKTFADFDKMTADVAESFTSSFGDAFEDVVMNSTSVRDAVGSLAQGIAGSMVNAIGQMAAQWLILQMVRKTSEKTAQASAASAMIFNAQAMSSMAGLNAYSSTAAIPIVGPGLASAAATAAVTATQPMAASVATYMLAGMAHDGIDKVPQTGTWLLKKNERVVTEKTSAKLDRMLENNQMASRQDSPAENKIRIVNAFDTSVVGDYLGSDAGEQKIMNVIRRNRSTISQFAGGG
jgi:hypothetical protein